jgi:hypothetical protein
VDNPVDSSPLVAILGLSSDHAERFKDVNDIINPSSLHAELSCALIKEEQIFLFFAVDAKETSAKLTQRLLLSIVLAVMGVEQAVSCPLECHGRLRTDVG